MNRILKIFHKEIAGIHQAAFLIGAFTLASQILALFRDRLLANYFGAGQTLDLYYTAFRIPDLIYAAVASLVSISVLIPFFSGVLENRKDEAKRLLSSVFTVFFTAMVLISGIAFLLMPYIVKFFFSGLGDSAVQAELVSLSRLLLLQPICLGISNVFGVVTQIGKRFFIYALSPIFYNLCIIGGLVFLYPTFGIKGVVMGVVVGGLVHFLIQMPFVISEGLLPTFTFKIDFKTVYQVFKVSIPRTIALSANMLELIIITSFASALAIGSVSIFNLALNLQSVPFAIVGVSYALAAFPTLSAYFAKGEKEQFMNQMITAARHVIFWSIPITALFVVLRAQIVRTVLGSGDFNWDNTRLTAACLSLFVLSLVGQGLELLFIRAYYAAGRTGKPLFINVISSIFTISFPWLLVIAFHTIPTFRFFAESLFKVEGIVGSDVIMLPLGYSIGTIINAIAFWIMFEKDFGSFSKHTLPTLFSSIQAAVFGGFVAYVGLNIFDNVFNLNTLSGIFLQGFCAGILGIAGIVGVFMLLGNKELGEVWSAAHQKISKNKIIVSEPDKIEV